MGQGQGTSIPGLEEAILLRRTFPRHDELGSRAEMKDYLKKGLWKCAASPTRAHHLVYDEERGIGVCKFCGAERGWPKIPTALH